MNLEFTLTEAIRPAHEEQQYSTDAVTENHARSMNKFNIKLTEKELKLPQIYWIPKLHKKPYKSRFI